MPPGNGLDAKTYDLIAHGYLYLVRNGFGRVSRSVLRMPCVQRDIRL